MVQKHIQWEKSLFSSLTKDMLKFDALFDELTTREHIQLYSRLHLRKTRWVGHIVEWALKKLNLTYYQYKKSGT
ncbi:ABCA2-like protein [Mya arenaria]|uniref:ABCA2-like protein n=1 Tax=Mya arenaria TaxID=6604 RepID=A0ABY7FZ22_MYAAR|nr:ABCA2-like protein [Mya arenaria]